MDRQIPIYFDTVVVSSPFQEIAGTAQNIGRMKVRAFTKYANRNGSYITDAVAEQLIASATKGNTPVVGFFDPGSNNWASHTGPTLANGYGYVESFEGWEPFTDTDGITRDYAVFSVVLFTDYFEEARNILGQNQSMELNPETIQGDWAKIDDDDTEYYIFSKAEILGFCVIGSHEPCFSVSAFFSKNDDNYKSQYEKFSSLLFDLKAQVEEAEKGGENNMDELELQEETLEQNDEPQIQPETEEPAPETTFEEVADEEVEVEEEEKEEEVEAVDFAAETEEEEESAPAEPSELEVLQQQFAALQADYDAAQVRISELEQACESSNAIASEVQARYDELAARVAVYEQRDAEELENKKQNLYEEYAKVILDADEMSAIQEKIHDFSYEELESKLAIMFAKQQMGSVAEEKVPLPEPPESQFALLMKKYRKN